MIIGAKQFDTQNGVYVVGILNVTPDSFSDGGKYDELDSALFRAERMIQEGADIIDVGGESTRPGHEQISTEQEIDRVYPVIAAIKERLDIPVSLDTYKSEVVKANLGHIDMVNDIWGFRHDPNMAGIVAKSGRPCCLMHNRKNREYIHFATDFFADIRESIDIAQSAGVMKENIILDGGVGFAKSYEQNLFVMNHTDAICALGYPVMIATSRKSCIGLTIEKDTADRLYGTIATTVVGVMKGASFIRVHDIQENCDAIRMTKSILEERKWIR